MTLEQLIIDLKAAGCNANTLQLAMNCYHVGQKEGASKERKRLADELQKQPLNDTAQSIAIWIRNGGQA